MNRKNAELSAQQQRASVSSSAPARWLVMKFGGSSVSSTAGWQTIQRQAAAAAKRQQPVMLVVSALAGVTAKLEELARGAQGPDQQRLLEEIDRSHHALMDALQMAVPQQWRALAGNMRRLAGQIDGSPLAGEDWAELLAHGEWMSSAIGAAWLHSNGLLPQWHDARTLLQVTDPGDYRSAACQTQPRAEWAASLRDAAAFHITQGFLAADAEGKTCLLGRGGSDTSAALLAVQLDAGRLEIWTDVPGVFTADPNHVPEARVLHQLSYSEAQELASMGAKVLHPPCIEPLRRQQIPLSVMDSRRPDSRGTRIGPQDPAGPAQVKGVVSRSGVTVINLEQAGMWQQSGFLAQVFTLFARHDFSVDLISTSESTVTLTLDPGQVQNDARPLQAVLAELRQICRVQLKEDCVSISLVGNSIRTILGQLSSAFDVFRDRRVHMLTQSANDLNLTLVVDSEPAIGLVRKLHQQLIEAQAPDRPELGPSWNELDSAGLNPDVPDPWWVEQRKALLQRMQGEDAVYAYRLQEVAAAAQRLTAMQAVDRVLYAIKANDHPEVLRTVAGQGLGFECVSLAEIHHVLKTVPAASPADILFTPNFAPLAEYRQALELGVQLTIDNAQLVFDQPRLVAGQAVFLRVDLDAGYGHHRKVVTSGADSKFGIEQDQLAEVHAALQAVGASVRGLHVHTGSGVSNPEVWGEMLDRLLTLAAEFPAIEVLDLGGGLSVPIRRGQAGLDLTLIDQSLRQTLRSHPLWQDRKPPQVWLEPGRYIASAGGVLLCRVTQVKQKGNRRFLGVAAGMNALIRPALYGAYHDIANLNRLDQAADTDYRVVGPICETGDVLAEQRRLPRSQVDDVILIANVGAYGRVMASAYNRRPPPPELMV